MDSRSRRAGLRHAALAKRRLRAELGARLLQAAASINHRHYVGHPYAPNARNERRYAPDRPNRALHGILARNHDRYRQALSTLGSFPDRQQEIPLRCSDDSRPAWINDWIPGLDGLAIYAFLRARRPAHYIEIGSGTSTQFAAQARRDGDLPTQITSIDPHPRSGIDELCDDVLREPLESVDLSVFARLGKGDVVFLDGSHIVYMNNDVVTFFLDVLPSLPPGILIGVHDIYIPLDYPDDIAERYYSEQYILAAYLLGRPELEVVLPAQYVTHTTEFHSDVAALWSAPHYAGVPRHGVAFWFVTGESE